MPELNNATQSDAQRARRTTVQVILLVTAAVIVAWLLYSLRAVLLLLTFTVIFCYLIAPLVDFVERPRRIGLREFRIPHSIAIAIVYALLLSSLAVALDKLIPLLSDQLTSFAENMPGYARQLDQSVKSLAALPNRYRLPQGWRQSLGDWMNAGLFNVTQWLQQLALRTVRLALFLPWLVLIPVIGFFFLKDAKRISHQFLSSLPQADMRYRVTVFLSDVSATLAGYMRAQLIACLLVGVIEGTGLWLLGVSYPLVLGVSAGLLEFVPVVGPLILGSTAVLLAGLHSTHSALLVFVFLAVFRLIHDYVIYPRLISEEVELHPIVVVLAVLSGAELAGVLGVFLSVPIAALLIVCWRHWSDLQQNRASMLAASDPKLSPENLSI